MKTNIEKLIEYIEDKITTCNDSYYKTFSQIERDSYNDILAKAKSLSQESYWVSVEKELPTESEDVLMTYKSHLGNWHTYTGYVFNGMWHFGEEGENVGDRIVTHWQPLPENPSK